MFTEPVTISTSRNGTTWTVYPDRHTVEDAETMARTARGLGHTLTPAGRTLAESGHQRHHGVGR